MNNIAVFRPGALGDTILTLPALAALRAAFPAARLTFVGNQAVLPLLTSGGCVDVVRSADDPALALLFASAEKPPPSLDPTFANLDLAVLWFTDHSMVADNLRRWGARLMVTAPSRPASQEGLHVADYLLNTLSDVFAGADRLPNLPYPYLACAAGDEQFADLFWRQNGLAGRRVVAIHPGSGGRWKCWPSDRFAALADLLADRGIAILLVRGPADEAVTAEFARALRSARPVAPVGLPLRALAGVLARCAALVGNDSGVSHLAAAIGTPVVALYGPTDPALWGVRGARVTHVVERALDAITVDQVVSVLEGLMAI